MTHNPYLGRYGTSSRKIIEANVNIRIVVPECFIYDDKTLFSLSKCYWNRPRISITGLIEPYNITLEKLTPRELLGEVPIMVWHEKYRRSIIQELFFGTLPPIFVYNTMYLSYKPV